MPIELVILFLVVAGWTWALVSGHRARRLAKALKIHPHELFAQVQGLVSKAPTTAMQRLLDLSEFADAPTRARLVPGGDLAETFSNLVLACWRALLEERGAPPKPVEYSDLPSVKTLRCNQSTMVAELISILAQSSAQIIHLNAGKELPLPLSIEVLAEFHAYPDIRLMFVEGDWIWANRLFLTGLVNRLEAQARCDDRLLDTLWELAENTRFVTMEDGVKMATGFMAQVFRAERFAANS